MHFLDDQVLQIGQGVLKVFSIATHIRRHIFQDGFFTEVELNHLGHIRINRFVICHTRADGVAQGHVAAAIHIEQARATQR